jgi:hypothetical protein
VALWRAALNISRGEAALVFLKILSKILRARLLGWGCLPLLISDFLPENLASYKKAG